MPDDHNLFHHEHDIDHIHYDVATHDNHPTPHRHEYHHVDFVTIDLSPTELDHYLDTTVADIIARRVAAGLYTDPIGCGGHDVSYRTR